MATDMQNVTHLVAVEPDGTFTFDTPLMASRFGWPAEVFQDYARRGLVRRQVEQGVEKDQGCWRVSIICGNRRWRGIIAGDGTLISEETGYVSSRAKT